MVTKKVLDELTAQLGEELYSAHLYLGMATWCDTRAFRGFGRWLRVQFGEEQAHAFRILNHLVARGAAPEIPAVPAPKFQAETVLQLFEAVLEHETHISRRVHRLYEIAGLEKDVAAQVFLNWYVTEQVEEEAMVRDVVDRLRIVGDKSSAALYLDKEYGKRVPKQRTE